MKRTHGGQSGQRRSMTAALGLCLLAFAGLASARVYKWKDAQGTVHYSDTPPPRGQAQLLKTDAQASPASGPAALPYELARAVQAAPVVLYTTARCDGCDQGRALLRARGIPFSERTVDSGEDQQQLERASGGKSELPLLLVGSRKIAGFQAAAWQEALSSAAYPTRKMLPPAYQFAPPAPAAGSQPASPTPPVRGQIKMPPDAAAVQAAEQQPRIRQSYPSGNTPPTP